MENWSLDHPGLGRFEAYVGWHDELRQIDPSYPEPDEDDSPEALAQTAAAKKADGRLGRLAGRVRPMLGMNEQWQRQGLVITRDGRTISRHQSIGSRKAPMARSLPDGKFTSSSSATKPYFDITADPLGRHLTDIHLKTEDEVVAFEPPEDSPAARRQDAMDASPWKRVVYPLLGGLGKSGWTIVMLLLAPVITEIIATVIAWIVELLAPLVPDIDWPNISLPSIPWPDLPNINWPDIPWPSLPSIPWPAGLDSARLGGVAARPSEGLVPHRPGRRLGCGGAPQCEEVAGQEGRVGQAPRVRPPGRSDARAGRPGDRRLTSGAWVAQPMSGRPSG